MPGWAFYYTHFQKITFHLEYEKVWIMIIAFAAFSERNLEVRLTAS
jgi:hypothetical protein